MTPDQIRTIPHSALCDADRLVYVRHPDGITRPLQPGCTCGAGLLRLLVGAR